MLNFRLRLTMAAAPDGVNFAFDETGPLDLDFSSPSSFFEAAFTYEFGLTVTACDSARNVLATVNGACGAANSGGGNYIGSGCRAPNEVIDITAPSISEIVITGVYAIDDVSFTGSVNAP